MPVAMFMEWKGVTKQQYDALRDIVGWEKKKAPGGLIHIAAFSDTGMRVTDVWETAEDFQRFVDERLMPEVKKLGVPGEPHVEIYPVHRLFTPAFEPSTPENRF